MKAVPEEDLYRALTAPTDCTVWAGGPNPAGPPIGFTEAEILPELRGVPVCPLVIDYLVGFRPASVRVVKESEQRRPWEEAAQLGRVTVVTEDGGRVARIYQEVRCGTTSGRSLAAALARLKKELKG